MVTSVVVTMRVGVVVALTVTGGMNASEALRWGVMEVTVAQVGVEG